MNKVFLIDLCRSNQTSSRRVSRVLENKFEFFVLSAFLLFCIAVVMEINLMQSIVANSFVAVYYSKQIFKDVYYMNKQTD